jgi:hypothetical protein
MLIKLMNGRANVAITVFHWLNPNVSSKVLRDIFLIESDLSLKEIE